MHAYLRAVGFKGITDKKKLKELLYEVTENPDEQKLISLGKQGGNVAELKKRFADNMGILVHGYYEDDGSFELEYYIPYVESSPKPIEDDVTITRHIARESFAGVSEDMRIGVTMIFYLENGMEYLEHAMKKKALYYHGRIYLSGLATGGMILLPASKNELQRKQGQKQNQNRRKLISDAKRGDEAAIESLTIEDLDTYSMISHRIRTEDVFTIVDSSFMPYGVECDQYSVIGEILDMKEMTNSYSGERVYLLLIECNDFEMTVAVNADDLMGEPQIGRRYKGAVWLSGRVVFADGTD